MRSGHILTPIFCCALLALTTGCNDDTGSTTGDNNGGFVDNNTPAPDMQPEPEPTPTPDMTPDMNEPEVNEPDMNEPEVNEPDMNEPDTNEPDMNEPEVNEPDMMVPECFGPEDCAEGELCVGEGCSEPWVCQGDVQCPEDGPEASYCSCDGVTFFAPVGCEGRAFAYRIDQNPPPPNGVRCDPEVEGPIFFDLVVSGSGFGDFDGGIAHIRIEDAPEGVDEVSAPISGGSFEVRLDRSFDPDRFGYFVNLYIDTDFDDVCDPGLEPSYGEFANNSFDFETQLVEVNFSPDSGEIPEICEEW